MTNCTCPSGDGSLRWPCPAHPPQLAPIDEILRALDLARGQIDGAEMAPAFYNFDYLTGIMQMARELKQPTDVSVETMAAPAGWKLVPIILTEEVLQAGYESAGQGMDYHEWLGRILVAWKSMIETCSVNQPKNADHIPDASNMMEQDADPCKLEAAQAQPETEERPCQEPDGCPTEIAVLQRFWRQHQQPVSGADDGLPPIPSAYNERGAYIGYGKSDLISYARAALAQQDADKVDAERYRLLRRGQHWSVINGIGDALRADELDAAIDAARKEQIK